jgi:lipopolysaccharide export system protein LptA
MMFFRILFTATLFSTAALCQESSRSPSLSSKEPVHIEATQGIKCNDKKGFCVASGNIVATQGRFTLTSDTLTTYFDENRQLIRLKAEGSVLIDPNDEQKAYGDEAHYEVNTQIITFIGNAKLQEVALQRTLEGDTIVAHLEENEDGETVANRVDAEGNVILTTDKDVTRGDKGLYLKGEHKAYITGNVKITQPDSQHNGEYAITNLDTGITELLPHRPDEPTDHHHKKVVKILFYPKDETKK